MGRAESLTRPPYLKEGDRVRVVAPSGGVNRERCEAGISLLESWGLVVERGRHLYGGFNIFSGSDAERLSDLQEALDDPGVKALFCARGGYGLSRIVDRIDYRAFMDNPCWIVGYSDITALHIWVNGFLGVASVHGEMIAGICDSSKKETSGLSLRDMLFHGGSTMEWECEQYVDGVAEGILSGGNLSLISNLAGATGAAVFGKRILFIEETGEFLYRFDRMIEGLRLAGISSAVAGLIAGSFSGMEDTEISFGADANTIVRDSFGEQGYPVATSFPAGHTDDNRALMLGASVRLTVAGGRCRLEYLISECCQQQVNIF
jgi:muramoyltetrapeptide carboxypeptidase